MSPSERLQAEERKAEILRASLAVFAMKGFAATTTKELAAAAGVSEGLLYKHFPGKETMYRELGGFICQDSKPVSAALARVEPSTQNLVLGIYYLSRVVLLGPWGGEEEHAYVLRIMCRSLLEDSTFANAFMESAFLPYVKPLESWFAAARAAGDLRTDAVSDRFAVFFAHHLMVGIKLHGLRNAQEAELGADADLVLRESVLFILRGAGLKDAAIRKHADFAKLDPWFKGLFRPPAHAAVSTEQASHTPHP